MIRPALTAALLLAASVPADAAMRVMQRIPGPDGGWDIVTVDAASHRLFVAHGDAVLTVDLASGSVTPRFVPATRAHEAFVMPGTGRGLVTNGGTDSVTLFDATSGAVVAEVPTGKKPDAAIWDARSRTAWIMNAGDGSATVVDPVAAKAVGSVEIGGALEYAVVDGRGHVFVAVEDKAEIAMVDIAKRQVVRRTALPGCEEPTGLGLTARGDLIAACANGVAKVVDTKSGRIRADIAIGLRPDAAFVDDARHRAYIPSGGDGTLTVIDTRRAPKAIATVPTQKGARTGAVDPGTGKVYLPAARYEAAVGTARPKLVPGSFEILVVGD